KALQLELYSNQIYQSLFFKLRELYGSAPYPIPEKSALRLFRLQEIFQIHNLFFRRYWSGDIDGEYHQMLIWCTNEELSSMRHNSHTFVDSTSRSTPAPFIQCLIVMVHDVCSLYILAHNFKKRIYVSPELIVLTKYSWMPRFLNTIAALYCLKLNC
ncbi:hypothetical protein HZS_737, partial [Henneguya salminicola]